MARRAVVDAAVVLEEVEEAARRIARGGRVESERVAHVREQEVAAAEIDLAILPGLCGGRGRMGRIRWCGDG
jgi:hypothetical protein